MSKKQQKAYEEFNLRLEKRGLPRVSRREFVKAMAIASAGLSIPWIDACTKENGTPPFDGGLAGTGNLQAGQGGAITTSPLAGGSGGSSGQTSAGSGGNAGGGKGGSNNAGKAGAAGSAGKAGASGAKADAGAAGSSSDTNSSKVGITRNADTTKAVATAIELAGGLDAIKQGQTVVIKPNISTGTAGVFTSLPVIRGIVEAVAAHTDKKNITIAECTAMGANTRSSATMAGYIGLVDELGINFLAFDEDPRGYALFKDPRWTHIKTQKSVPVSLNPMSFDHFISAPILKNHQMVDLLAPGCNVQFTSCMKLFVGILPYSGPGSRSDPADDIHTADLGEKVAELGCIVPNITMCVVDALRPGILNGPTPTQYADAGLILASSDRVACDSVAFAVLKTYAKKGNVNMGYVTQSVWTQAQIKRGGELGLGFADPKKITIVDKDVDNIAEIKAQWV